MHARFHRGLVIAAIVTATASCSHKPEIPVEQPLGDTHVEAVEAPTPAAGPRPPSVAPAVVHVHEAAPCAIARVHFATGSADLDIVARERLGELAWCVGQNGASSIRIIGRADPSGDPLKNIQLGRARGLAAADYLRGLGVDQEILVESEGEEGARPRPFWPLDRSVEIEVKP